MNPEPGTSTFTKMVWCAEILVHYKEIAIKGRNRPWFVERLVRNIRTATLGTGVAEVRALMSRVEVRLDDEAQVDEVSRRLARVFGIANFASARRTAADLDAIIAAALEVTEGLEPQPFRVSAARADKRFPMSSPEIERRVGAAVVVARAWPVKLDPPHRRIHVEIVPGAAYVYAQREAGPGGLPVGVSGRALCLLSGGIDSPVAAWRMMRRGCPVSFVHVHGYPLTSPASIEKAQRLAGVLAHCQPHTRLLLVPFADVHRHIVAAVPPALRTLIFRRAMFRAASLLAPRLRARAMVTGEVVGQVASQTLENLAATEAAATVPVLRPLIGLDKDEIVAEAIRIGTFETSILPDEDCCQLLSPRHPATRARSDRSRSRRDGAAAGGARRGRRRRRHQRTLRRERRRAPHVRIQPACVVVAQRFFGAAEGQRIPGNRALVEASRLEAFIVNRELAGDRRRRKDDDDWRPSGVGVDVDETVDADVETALLARFADDRDSIGSPRST